MIAKGSRSHTGRLRLANVLAATLLASTALGSTLARPDDDAVAT